MLVVGERSASHLLCPHLQLSCSAHATAARLTGSRDEVVCGMLLWLFSVNPIERHSSKGLERQRRQFEIVRPDQVVLGIPNYS